MAIQTYKVERNAIKAHNAIAAIIKRGIRIGLSAEDIAADLLVGTVVHDESGRRVWCEVKTDEASHGWRVAQLARTW